ncbi:hypothetical protein Golax_015468, partial [Gossypium laxum]|nr:hypothetical protein [Gossypium laxum]
MTVPCLLPKLSIFSKSFFRKLLHMGYSSSLTMIVYRNQCQALLGLRSPVVQYGRWNSQRLLMKRCSCKMA